MSANIDSATPISSQVLFSDAVDCINWLGKYSSISSSGITSYSAGLLHSLVKKASDYIFYNSFLGDNASEQEECEELGKDHLEALTSKYLGLNNTQSFYTYASCDRLARSVSIDQLTCHLTEMQDVLKGNGFSGMKNIRETCYRNGEQTFTKHKSHDSMNKVQVMLEILKDSSVEKCRSVYHTIINDYEQKFLITKQRIFSQTKPREDVQQ